MRVARVSVLSVVAVTLFGLALITKTAAAEPSPPPPARAANQLAARFESLRASYQDMTYAELAQRLHLQTDGADAELTFDPRYISYYEDVQKALALTPEEQDLYRCTGVVSVDHDRRFNMANAYLAIYQNDLPVLITADSMLPALHRSFDNILMSSTHTEP